MPQEHVSNLLSRVALVAALAVAGCADDGKDKAESCSVEDPASCEAGLVCEQLGDTRRSCLPPVMVGGRVFDALAGTPIAGATVVGLDSNAAARTRVVLTGADGRYQLPVSTRRADDGTPVSDAITLRVAAADHQPFATAPRTALPVDLATATKSEANYTVSNAATDVALIPLPAAERGGVTVQGKVNAPAPAGVLVLAVAGDFARTTAVSDLDGAFTLFNVQPGSTTLEGYRAGLGITAKPLDVPAGGVTGVVLEASSSPLSTVSGSVNIVNAAGGSTTSVILAVASTFDPDAIRGEAPAGLRATNVSGAFRIEKVPPGRYAVLAAYENDQLVRDPDLAIAGTDIVFVEVGASGAETALPQSFKVTGALAVLAPGANGPEQVSRGATLLSWGDDSSEDGYELRVFDALGNLVHENTQVARVSGGANAQYTLDTTSFMPGMLYQFRVTSYRNRQGGRSYISASEDLKGVFEIKP